MDWITRSSTNCAEVSERLEREHNRYDVFCFYHFRRMQTIVDRGYWRDEIENRNNTAVSPKRLSNLVLAKDPQKDRASEVRIDSLDEACSDGALLATGEESVLAATTVVVPLLGAVVTETLYVERGTQLLESLKGWQHKHSMLQLVRAWVSKREQCRQLEMH